MGSTGDSWTVLASRVAATQRRVRSLEWEPDRRNSFAPYTVERESAYADLEGRRYLMMSGYSYLGLGGDQRVVDAANTALAHYGTGNHGVRALAGSTPLHEELEQEVARFADRESSLVFSSGYAANVGVIGGLVGPGDTVFIDKYDHASIVDGCHLSGATVTRFRHNDVRHLEKRLAASKPEGVRLVVVDSVYSMDGDIAPFPELRRVCDEYGALLMVDEAHALGVIGPRGGGIEEHFGNRWKADVKLGTLSKGIPSTGGWVAGSQSLMTHFKYAARPFLFSAALAPAQAAAALAALRILKKEPERVTRIQQESARLKEILTEAGMRTGESTTAVIPLIIGSDEDTYDYATQCRHEGVIALPVVTPAVPQNLARLRIAVTAKHTTEDIDTAAHAFLKAAHSCGILPG